MNMIEDVYFWSDKYGMPRGVDIGGIKNRPNFITDNRPHRLHFYEIIFITEGEGQVNLNGETYTVMSGRVLVFRPYSIRSWSARNLDGVCLAFESDFLPPYIYDGRDVDETQVFSLLNKPVYLKPDQELFDTLCQRLKVLARDVDKQELLIDELLRSGASEILLQLERYIASSIGDDRTFSQSQNPIVSKFIKAVETNFRSQHQVQFYAREIAVSERHLNHLLNETLGLSASVYIRRRLVEEAKRLLRHSDMSLGQMAYDLGYADSAHFSKSFKRVSGLTPSRFRQQTQYQ
ncbi:helix-turn-helix domain-containing protein [Kordiimonas sp. SCSIO 12610]|uniref:AraC family transcriptional regulator n=1 Tax=Kordiimonas sp. SCSIO 12610 TaxID=2829597 RepID=UPI0021091767|nr:helix-turn-helix domain-containing protein [Kordiimonas sp. SCSIO 12610]UTW54132.1 AraC family transcriptional regulator [Kordiimonas sp. SCSIO 12610]